MTDLERIARAIWADRASRILAEDIAAQREDGSPGHMSYDELGEGFQRGLLSEARAAMIEAREPTEAMVSAGLHAGGSAESEEDDFRNSFRAQIDIILNGENATTT